MIVRRIYLSLFSVSFVLVALGSSEAYADPASISSAPVVFIAPGFPVVAGASSKIVRTDNGVTVSVSTIVDPGTYTMWWLVWNSPGDCTGNAGLQCDPAVDPPECVLFAAGHVVGNNGTLNYTGHRKIFDNSGAIGPPCPNGINNPQGAAIHGILRSHGPILPGQVDLQISTVGGGCDVNTCADVQATAHELF